MRDDAPSLADAQALIGLDRTTLLDRLAATPEELQRGDYGSTKGMEALDARPPLGGTVYMVNGKVALVSLFRGLKPLPGPTVFTSLNPDTLSAAYPNAVRLGSRSGKHYNHMVDAESGIAWSEGDGRVSYAEVFEPMDLETYKQRFYENPPFQYK